MKESELILELTKGRRLHVYMMSLSLHCFLGEGCDSAVMETVRVDMFMKLVKKEIIKNIKPNPFSDWEGVWVINRRREAKPLIPTTLYKEWIRTRNNPCSAVNTSKKRANSARNLNLF